MRTAGLLCYLAGSGAYRAPSQPVAKSISGVPILNYKYRAEQHRFLADEFSTHQVRAQDESYDWVLKFQEDVDDEQISQVCEGIGQAACRSSGHPSRGGLPMAAVHATEQGLEKLLKKFGSLLEWVEPDTPVKLEDVDAKQEVQKSQWGHGRIGLHRSRFDGNGVHIYVMDTGIRTTHRDFEGRAIPTLDTVQVPGTVIRCAGTRYCALDSEGHGTHCAATAGGKVYGVAKRAKLYAMRVCCGPSWMVHSGLDWLAQDSNRGGLAVVTMSIGSRNVKNADRVAVDKVVRAGVTVVVSAGNDNINSCDKSYSNLGTVIAVASMDQNNTRVYYSNWGKCNTLFAPGWQIRSAARWSDEASEVRSGTSMATPHVAGVAALILQESPHLNPGWVRNVLYQRGRKGVLNGLKTGDPNLLLYAVK